MVAGSFLFFALFWLEIASTCGISLELLSLQNRVLKVILEALLESKSELENMRFYE